MATLYELVGEWNQLLEMSLDDDIDEQALADTFEGIEGEIEIKADGYAKYMKSVEVEIAKKKAEADAIKAEADRIYGNIKTIENAQKRVKKALEDAMKATGKTKFKTELFSFNIQKNKASVVLEDNIDISTLPPQFLRFKEPEVDKKAVEEAIKAGEDISFAKLVQTEGLRIR